MMGSPHIRWNIRRDLPEIVEIESLCFGDSWTEADLLFELRKRNCIGHVVETNERVVGFMLYELHPKRMHVMRMAVHPNFRRMGFGRMMVKWLLLKLSTHRRSKISIDVRESNLGAQRFFREHDFKAVEVIREFFGDNSEDAYRMEFGISERI